MVLHAIDIEDKHQALDRKERHYAIFGTSIVKMAEAKNLRSRNGP